MLRVPPLHRSAAFRLQNRGQQEGVGKSRWGRQFEQFCSLKAALLCPEILRYVVTDEMRPAARATGKNCRLTPLPHPGIIAQMLGETRKPILLHPRSAQYGRTRKSKFLSV